MSLKSLFSFQFILWTVGILVVCVGFGLFVANLSRATKLGVADQLSIVAATLSLLTIIFVVGQVQLAVAGFRIMERQNRILDRRAKLSLGYEVRGETPMFDSVSYEDGLENLYDCWFSVWNDGDRSSGPFYLVIYDPYPEDHQVTVADDSFDVPNFYIQDAPGTSYFRKPTKFFDKPVFPGTYLRTKIRLMTKDIQIKTLRWQIISEDGVFPGPASYGIVEVDFV